MTWLPYKPTHAIASESSANAVHRRANSLSSNHLAFNLRRLRAQSRHGNSCDPPGVRSREPRRHIPRGSPAVRRKNVISSMGKSGVLFHGKVNDSGKIAPSGRHTLRFSPGRRFPIAGSDGSCAIRSWSAFCPTGFRAIEIRLRPSLVDNRYGRRADAVAFVEFAARQQRNAHGGKESRSDAQNVSSRSGEAGAMAAGRCSGSRLTQGHNRPSPGAAADQRRIRHGRGRARPGSPSDAFRGRCKTRESPDRDGRPGAHSL